MLAKVREGGCRVPGADHGEPLLSLRDVAIAFGGVHAVEDVGFDVPEGAILSLIGPNGAGKTTVLNSISGFVRARGSIRYRSPASGRGRQEPGVTWVELIGKPAFRRAELGIGRTFQNLQLFQSMTLLDNVMAGQHSSIAGNVLYDMLWFPVFAEERRARRRALELLRLLGIERYAARRADGLPFGVQKLAGVARALAVNPRLLLLDEPAAGLNAHEATALADLIVRLRQELGVTVLLVEHNMRLVMRISDYVVVLDEGRKLTEGLPDQVGRDPAVIEAYLGAHVSAAVEAEVEMEVRDELAERA
jgi:ABC-type branched-subunit amino acid transport system ATPase component